MIDRLQHARAQLATSFGYRRGPARGQGRAGGRRVRTGRDPLRPDERPDERRPAPAVEGRRMIDWLAPRPGLRLLDVAGGTGDIAFRVLDRVARKPGRPPAQVTVCDINRAMLAVGRDRAIDAAPDRAGRLAVRRCRGAAAAPIAASTPTRSRSASATSPGSSVRSPRRAGCCGRAAGSCAWSSRSCSWRPCARSTIATPSPWCRGSASWSPTTAPPTSIWSRASGAFPTRPPSRA